MFVRRLEMENVKGYENACIDFSQGVNIIAGMNGAGKTSIMEAIGFAIFLYSPLKIADFIRAGEKKAIVRVDFVSNHDERIYRVERHCGSGNLHKIHDIQLGNDICIGRDEVTKFLCQHIGVNSSTTLPDLFKNAIGVPQGTFVTPFLMAGNVRKSIFDPLIGITDYKKSFELLRKTVTKIKELETENSIHLSRVNGELVRYPDIRSSLRSTVEAKASFEEDVVILSDSLAKAQVKYLEMAEERERHVVIAQQISGREEMVKMKERAFMDARNNVQESQTADERMKASKKGHDLFLEAQKTQDQINDKIVERNRMKGTVAQLGTRVSRLHSEVISFSRERDRVKKEGEKLKDSSVVGTVCPHCKQIIVEDHRLERLGELREKWVSLGSDIDAKKREEDVERVKYDNIMEQYSQIDSDIANAVSVKNRYQREYDTYTKSKPLAEQYAVRSAAMNEAEFLLNEEKVYLETLLKEREDLGPRFDVAKFNRARNLVDSLQTEEAKLNANIENCTTRIEQLKSEVNRMKELEVERKEYDFKERRLKGVRTLLEFIRATVNESSPRMAEALIHKTSREANQIFCQIMNDFSHELQWKKDYDVVVNMYGQDRGFVQLSGGEQMTAALSIRLAILQEMSDAGLVFFDEPTTNLDETRRRTLTEQIEQIHGFEQIFVISHDDSFESITENLIRVEKVDGISQVLQEPI